MVNYFLSMTFQFLWYIAKSLVAMAVIAAAMFAIVYFICIRCDFVYNPSLQNRKRKEFIDEIRSEFKDEIYYRYSKKYNVEYSEEEWNELVDKLLSEYFERTM